MGERKLKISFSCLFDNAFACVKKLPWTLGRRAFVVIIFLVILDIIVGVLIFYNNILLAEAGSYEIVESPSAFKTDVYQRILEEWQQREQNLQSVEAPDVF